MASGRYKAIVCLVIILASAGWLGYYYGSQPGSGEAIPSLKPAACAACGKAYIAEFGDEPALCSLCGKRALGYAWKCGNPGCGAIYTAPGQVESGRVTRPCPNCGHSSPIEVRREDLAP